MNKNIVISICLIFLITAVTGCHTDNAVQPRVGYSKEEIIGVLLKSYELNRIDL